MPRSSNKRGPRVQPLDAVFGLPERIGRLEDGQGIITLTDPQDHTIQRVFRRLRFRIPPERRLTLDEYGSFVVRQIDGRASVADIGQALKERFGAGAEPVFERLVPYLGALEQRHLIIRRPAASPHPESPSPQAGR